MATMNISLPDAMKVFVDDQVAVHGYSSSSEFLRDLIRREQDRQRLHELIHEGLASPPGMVADATYFERMRERVRSNGSA